jgi:peptidoglycan/LPS O-acetylase OafA/YrhL
VKKVGRASVTRRVVAARQLPYGEAARRIVAIMAEAVIEYITARRRRIVPIAAVASLLLTLLLALILTAILARIGAHDAGRETQEKSRSSQQQC